MPLRQTLFISDLHLDANHPEITAVFLRFLTQNHEQTDAIYILGDLFEAWVGDDDQSVFHNEIIRALKATNAAGIPVYFLRGNRDFLIGKRFARESGCQLLKDEEKIYLYNTPVLLMHGDTLCTDDVLYIRARSIAHTRAFKLLFGLLPLRFRKRIAQKTRKQSNAHKKTATRIMMDVNHQAVNKVLQKHGAEVLIHGHTHRPAFHTHTLPFFNATRIVLGAWHRKGSILVWQENGEKKLHEFL